MIDRAATEIKMKYLRNKEITVKKKHEKPELKLALNFAHIHYPHEKCELEQEVSPRIKNIVVKIDSSGETPR